MIPSFKKKTNSIINNLRFPKSVLSKKWLPVSFSVQPVVQTAKILNLERKAKQILPLEKLEDDQPASKFTDYLSCWSSTPARQTVKERNLMQHLIFRWLYHNIDQPTGLFHLISVLFKLNDVHLHFNWHSMHLFQSHLSSRNSPIFVGQHVPLWSHTESSRPETGSLLETRAVCHTVASHHEGLMPSAISDFIQRPFFGPAW